MTLIGKRVRIVLDEDGTPEPPILPPGTVTRRLAGPDRDDYILIRLDAPVECVRASSEARWFLHDLVVVPVFVGDKLDDLFVDRTTEFVLVAVANVMTFLEPKENRFDHSQIEYFGRGRILRIG